LLEKITDTEDDYIITSDGIFNTTWEDIPRITKTWTVDDDKNECPDADFTKIQDAINDESVVDGDMILVYPGNYSENVVMNKSITLKGENKNNTIINGSINGNQTKPVIEIVADNCIVSGFTLKNGCKCIFLNHSNNSVITDTNVEYSKYISIHRDGIIIVLESAEEGISLYHSNNNTIANNRISHNSGGGICLEHSSNNTLRNNNILDNWIGVIERPDGIELIDSSYNTITDNIVNSNGRYGIYLTSSNNNMIVNNTINLNRYCNIHLWNSSDNKIMNNIISNIFHFGDGIELLYKSSNNMITNNDVSNNDYGIYLDSSNYNNIYHNNLIDNNKQSYDNGNNNSWDNGYPSGGNYWSDHECEGNPSNGSQPYYIEPNGVDHYPFQDENGWLILWNVRLSSTAPEALIPDEIKFGVAKNATIWFDPWCDKEEESLISMPGIRAYFYCPNISNSLLLLDESYIGTRDSLNWDLGISFNPGLCAINKTNVTITWKEEDLKDVPEKYSLYLLDHENNITVNMRAQSSYTFIYDVFPIYHSAYNFSVTIECNKIPVASFTYSPDNPVVNETITFNASSSYDPDANITNYTWDFGDGNITNTTEKIITHSYASAGTYIVNLTVTDNDGATNSTSKLIKVSELEELIFDTGAPLNPYPSIAGTHNGTIKPNHTIIATKLYTYPCTGTGGHTEYAKIWNKTWNATATWEGYESDWHNITFDKTVVLLPNKTYNYTIRTGSYPQIHHNTSLLTPNGWINCTKFVDTNGKIYDDWIPAIRLE